MFMKAWSEGQLHNLQGSMQNENMNLLFKGREKAFFFIL